MLRALWLALLWAGTYTVVAAYAACVDRRDARAALEQSLEQSMVHAVFAD